MAYVCTCICVLMCVPTRVGNIAQREHTRQLHFTVESSGSNILAEWTSNHPNDLRAVKDIAANSNCKKYIGFRRGMAFGRLCLKTTLGERKVEGCSSHREIITLGALVQSWRCGEKLKASFSAHHIYSRCWREIQLHKRALATSWDRFWSCDFPCHLLLPSVLSSYTLQSGRNLQSHQRRRLQCHSF